MILSRTCLTAASRFACRAASLITFALVARAASAQQILSITERAQPGELVSINGASFGATPEVWAHYVGEDGSTGPDVRWSLLGSTDTALLTQVPSNMGGRLWQVWVKTSGGTSPVTYVNQARAMMVDWTEAAPGQNIRIFGRNMKAAGSYAVTPYVRLVPSTGTKATFSIRATVIQSSPYQLTFTVPSNIKARINYRVLVSNGAGGSSGESEVPQRIVGLAPGTDSLGTGIPWATQMTFLNNIYDLKNDPRLVLRARGDGITEDSQALRAAIATAKAAGGGAIYIPSGVYRMDDGGPGLEVPSNVVLKGDGPGKTILQFGYRYTLTNPAHGDEGAWIGFDVGDLAGMMNMTFQNLNTGLTPNQTICRHWYSYPHAHRFFFWNVDMQLANGRGVYMPGTLKGVIQDCNITTTSLETNGWSGPIILTDCDQWVIRRTTFNYRVSRTYIEWCTHVIFEGNTVNRDNNYSSTFDSGGLETSYSSQIVILGNTVQGVGPIYRSTADGEMIMNQKSTIQDVSDVGTVTSASPTTLTNAARNWPSVLTASGYAPNRSTVAIIAGKGLGQWRAVASSTNNTLAVSSPWTITPDSTSVYALSTFSCYQQYVLNNTVNNSSYGIQFYDGAVDSVIDSNRVNNAASIFLRCQDSSWTSNNSTRRHNIGWGVSISNNTVTNTDGNRMAQVCVGAVIEGAVSYGNLVMNVDCKSNFVQSQNPINYPNVLGSAEGMWNKVVFEDDPVGHADPDANIGTIWQGNASNLNNFFNDVGTRLTGYAGGVGNGP